MPSTAAKTAAMQLEPWDICLRLLCAMLIGLVIGTEREYTHRPAGMRTHILVALGSCSVMLTGQMLYIQYSALGALPDPARLGAQVITGVGFLGAGTILRDGANVKGLTTAASLWAVACLGLAAGSGYYAIALTGMVFILATLTIFEVLQRRLVGSHSGELHYRMETCDISAGLQLINTAAQRCRAEMSCLQARTLQGGFAILFRAAFPGTGSRRRQQSFFEALSTDPCCVSVSIGSDGTSGDM